MMVEIVKFKKEHALRIDEQDAERWLAPYLTEEKLEALEAAPYSFSGLVGEKVVGCAGVIEIWPGRAAAWAMLAKSCRSEFIGFHLATKRFLENCPFRRVEAQVDCGFRAGHRWMALLGFELEADRMQGFFPDGRDGALYALVKEGKCL